MIKKMSQGAPVNDRPPLNLSVGCSAASILNGSGSFASNPLWKLYSPGSKQEWFNTQTPDLMNLMPGNYSKSIVDIEYSHSFTILFMDVKTENISYYNIKQYTAQGNASFADNSLAVEQIKVLFNFRLYFETPVIPFRLSMDAGDTMPYPAPSLSVKTYTTAQITWLP